MSTRGLQCLVKFSNVIDYRQTVLVCVNIHFSSSISGIMHSLLVFVISHIDLPHEIRNPKIVPSGELCCDGNDRINSCKAERQESG